MTNYKLCILNMKKYISPIILLSFLFIDSVTCFADINSDLRVAATLGKETLVERLLNEGADVNSGGPATNRVPAGVTALMGATAQNYPKIVKLLISRGADINQADKGGATALIYTVWKGHKDLVKLLIEKGANVNARTKDGRTPLSVAEASGHLAIAKLLKNAGAKY